MSLQIAATAKQHLDALVDALRSCLGNELSSVIVHGSGARGAFRDGLSDVDVIIVVKAIPFEKLLAIGNPLQLARAAARIEAMVLTEEEIQRAADVFPLLYRDVKRAHVVVFGSDPFAQLVIADHHLRLRIEQELREAQIRMRRAVADAAGNDSALESAVVRKVKQVRSPLHALLSLVGREVGDELPTVIEAASETWGGRASAMLDVHADPKAAHVALVSLLDSAIAVVDKMDAGVRT
jgi:predicted nucleotidyltransferase